MFYIDFTSPKGKTYRIDLSELPITYVCPVCGDEQIVLLHNPDSADWCDCFEERYKEKKKGKMKPERKNVQRKVTRFGEKT